MSRPVEDSGASVTIVRNEVKRIVVTQRSHKDFISKADIEIVFTRSALIGRAQSEQSE
jgi:hypothetical protein